MQKNERLFLSLAKFLHEAAYFVVQFKCGAIGQPCVPLAYVCKKNVRIAIAVLAFFLFAERIGFEPTKPFRGLHAFQACLFNHSSTFPGL